MSISMNKNIKKNYFQTKMIERKNTNEKKITVVIPCHYKHFGYIESLLKLYDSQTLIPEEIILIICEIEKLQNKTVKIKELKKNVFKFSLVVVEIIGRSAAGNNRYIGTKMAKNGIVVFQDADDIPHVQRLEIFKYFFDKYPTLVHIVHRWTKKDDMKKYTDFSSINYKLLNFDIFLNPIKRIPEHLANGNVAIKKNIYNNVNWYKDKFRAQDIYLNSSIYNRYKQSLMIREPIYFYRKNLSVKNYV